VDQTQPNTTRATADRWGATAMAKQQVWSEKWRELSSSWDSEDEEREAREGAEASTGNQGGKGNLDDVDSNGMRRSRRPRRVAPKAASGDISGLSDGGYPPLPPPLPIRPTEKQRFIENLPYEEWWSHDLWVNGMHFNFLDEWKRVLRSRLNFDWSPIWWLRRKGEGGKAHVASNSLQLSCFCGS